MYQISSFMDKYHFLSNFHITPILYEGVTYPSVEHAFQAAKTLNKAERMSILKAFSPGVTKRIGKTVSLRDDWESVKVNIMRDLLEIKFSDPDLREKLLSTKDARLIEGNTWGDKYWGCIFYKGNWVGSNKLGELLMNLRSQLRNSDGC